MPVTVKAVSSLLLGAIIMVFQMGSTGASTEGTCTEDRIPSYYRQLKELDMDDLSSSAPVEQEQMETHTVQRGDTLYYLASRYDTDILTLAELNRMDPRDLLPVGKELQVVNTSGKIHRVEEGECWSELASEYGVELSEIKRLSPEEHPEPVEGEKLLLVKEREMITASTAENNKEVPPADREAQLSRSATTGEPPSFQWPLRGRITSPFGPRNQRFHYGIDIAASRGTPVKAAAAGQVTVASHTGSYGLLLELEHGGGWKSRYAHNSGLEVEKGEQVSSGQTVALVGNTGNATGPHLHFEILRGGQQVDPLKYLPR